MDEVPKAIDFQSHLGVALAAHGKCLVESGKMADAKTAFQSAVSHQRQAVQLSRNRDQFRTLLGEHLLDLAQANISLNDYKAAAANALDVPNAVPISERGQGCLDAARILARLVTRADRDQKLPQGDRVQLTRNYLGRTIVLLREVIDTNPKLVDQIKNDADIKSLETRPDFQTIMNTLVNLGQ